MTELRWIWINISIIETIDNIICNKFLDVFVNNCAL